MTDKGQPGCICDINFVCVKLLANVESVEDDKETVGISSFREMRRRCLRQRKCNPRSVWKIDSLAYNGHPLPLQRRFAFLKYVAMHRCFSWMCNCSLKYFEFGVVLLVVVVVAVVVVLVLLVANVFLSGSYWSNKYFWEQNPNSECFVELSTIICFLCPSRHPLRALQNFWESVHPQFDHSMGSQRASPVCATVLLHSIPFHSIPFHSIFDIGGLFYEDNPFIYLFGLVWMETKFDTLFHCSFGSKKNCRWIEKSMIRTFPLQFLNSNTTRRSNIVWFDNTWQSRRRPC